jgi:hypothetical protein
MVLYLIILGMKIRIKGNSIRIRVTRSEIEQFGNTGRLEERTEFGGNAFVYVLSIAGESKDLSAGFIDGKMTVTVPESITKEWTTTERVGYEHNMPIGGGKYLYLLIEKDFKCIDNEAEDQSDHYEHPDLSCA